MRTKSNRRPFTAKKEVEILVAFEAEIGRGAHLFATEELWISNDGRRVCLKRRDGKVEETDLATTVRWFGRVHCCEPYSGGLFEDAFLFWTKTVAKALESKKAEAQKARGA